MKTQHRFHFPKVTGRNVQELPSDFDFHVSIGDRIEFEAIPGTEWVVTQKKFKVLFDGSVEYVDYETDEA
ncbi:hypothetical protein GKKCFE_21880 [Pseudomonas sp. E141]|jgi:hypothetical protein|uniref:Phage protein n=1 Tax=Pseudomonas rhizophila TaxID=2045200 RepID=A0ABM6UCR1_9PSED|nr:MULTISPECIES: hypothetical protein [Pseudomonas]AVU75202.1 hypothetical protein CRX69_08305 [Pseudomonas rhizophila]MDD2029980.1 hypothetical protein [Pseudomonas sp. 39167]MEA1030149.1 hypothetical protein [Pseudomonas sp. N-137]WLG22493.1 hypothetical protein PSH91_22620 [Pseudomonas sp. FP1154]